MVVKYSCPLVVRCASASLASRIWSQYHILCHHQLWQLKMCPNIANLCKHSSYWESLPEKKYSCSDLRPTPLLIHWLSACTQTPFEECFTLLYIIRFSFLTGSFHNHTNMLLFPSTQNTKANKQLKIFAYQIFLARYHQDFSFLSKLLKRIIHIHCLYIAYFIIS